MMADDPQPNAAELASAYLDGEATPDERARVEGDPALLAEVERLRAVAAAVAEVPAPSADRRDAAVAAALAAFDELRVGTTPPPAPPATVSSLDRRRQARRMQALTAVAAAAVLVVGGFVIANRDGDDDSAGEIRQAPVSARAVESPVTSAESAAPDVTLEPAGSEPSAEFAESDAAADAEDEPLAAAPPPAAPATSVPSQGAAADAAAATEPPIVSDAAELRTYVETLDDEPPPVAEVIAACEEGPSPAPPEARFEDDDGVLTDIAVALTADGYAAVALDDCAIVLRSTG